MKHSIGLHFKLIDCFHQIEFLLESISQQIKDVILGNENTIEFK